MHYYEIITNNKTIYTCAKSKKELKEKFWTLHIVSIKRISISEIKQALQNGLTDTQN